MGAIAQAHFKALPNTLLYLIFTITLRGQHYYPSGVEEGCEDCDAERLNGFHNFKPLSGGTAGITIPTNPLQGGGIQ